MYYTIKGNWGPIQVGPNVIPIHEINLIMNLRDGIPEFTKERKEELDRIEDAINKINALHTKDIKISAGGVNIKEYSRPYSIRLDNKPWIVWSKDLPIDSPADLSILYEFIRNPQEFKYIELNGMPEKTDSMSRALLSDYKIKKQITEVSSPNNRSFCCFKF